MTRTRLCRTFALWVVGCCLSLLLAVQTKAQTDPSTLHIGAGAGTTCAMGCAGDPNLIGSGNTVDIFNQSMGGPQTEVPPILLILGVPNIGSALFASNPITGVMFINPYPGGTSTAVSSAFATAGTYGLKAVAPATGTNGYFGSMGTGQEVYSFLGLTGPTNNSNSFTNWSGADLTINSITASNFGIYVFALTSTVSLGPNGLVNIMFTSGSLPLGTFVVAYGQSSGGVPDVVPFTEAGLTAARTTVPEPGSMALFGTGLVLVLRRAIRRRLSNKQV